MEASTRPKKAEWAPAINDFHSSLPKKTGEDGGTRSPRGKNGV
jgi:hypothetical protein